MMFSHSKIFALALVAAVLLCSCPDGSHALTLPQKNHHHPPTLSPPKQPQQPPSLERWAQWGTATAAVVAANIPQVVYAAIMPDDDYEYGKVDAPIGIAVAGGLLAILTAAVPVLLRPGEEALEEMRENEGYTFGSKDSSNTLNKKR